jgi:hypothetical protein
METRPMAEASPQFPCHDAGPGVRGRSLPPQPPRWHGPWPLADSSGAASLAAQEPWSGGAPTGH